MTKPQAFPFLVPFGAWFLATQGWRGTLKAAIVGAVVVVLLWLPFVAAGGPGNYLGNLGTYQNDIFGVLSIRAWNPWALLQELGAEASSSRIAARRSVPSRSGSWASCSRACSRWSSSSAVYRRPTADQLALGLAAMSLAAFVALTTMHERYAYPALVFLLFALGRPAVAVAWVAFAVTFLLDCWSRCPRRAGRSRTRGSSRSWARSP